MEKIPENKRIMSDEELEGFYDLAEQEVKMLLITNPEPSPEEIRHAIVSSARAAFGGVDEEKLSVATGMGELYNRALVKLEEKGLINNKSNSNYEI